MNQIDYIKSEVKNYIKFLYPELNETDLNNKVAGSEYHLNEEGNRILIEIQGEKQGIVCGWSDTNGIYGLDEDRDFDEQYQEGEE